jgi:threonine synthase
MIHGAVIIQIKGNFDDGMRLVKEVAEHAPVSIVNSINPFRLQGQKTAASRSRGRSVACRGTNNRLRASFNCFGYCHRHTAVFK